MGKPNFSDEFKRDVVAQISERWYPVAEVSQRLGMSLHSLYAWKRQFAQHAKDDAKDAEISAYRNHAGCQSSAAFGLCDGRHRRHGDTV